MLKKIVCAAVVAATMGAVSAQTAQAATGVWATTGNQHGTTQIGWSSRGSSCHIKYTEAGQNVYKYETVAPCDQAMIEIGHLTPGVTYKFMVKQDGATWSPVVTARAASATNSYQAPHDPQPVAQAPEHRETVTESFPKDDYPVEYYTSCNTQGSMQTMGHLNHDERKTGKCGTGMTNIRTVSGHNSGQVTVYWSDNMLGADDYHLVYGTEPGHYTMGALHIGGASNSYTVTHLQPGKRYYFKLVPLKEGKTLGSTWEVSDVAR